MRPLMVIGLVLLILGVLALGYQGVAWITTRDTVAQAGPLTIQADREHAIPLARVVDTQTSKRAAGRLLYIAPEQRRNRHHDFPGRPALGLFDRFVPSFVKPYANLGATVVEAAGKYVDEVRSGRFPLTPSPASTSKSN